MTNSPCHGCWKLEMTADRMAWLSLGGNLGDVEDTFARVRKNLESMSGGAVNSSSIYRTQPWGRIDQPYFLNQVIGFVPRDSLEETHLLLQHLERAEGRSRTEHWGPRTVDIDILYWPNRQCSMNSSWCRIHVSTKGALCSNLGLQSHHPYSFPDMVKRSKNYWMNVRIHLGWKNFNENPFRTIVLCFYSDVMLPKHHYHLSHFKLLSRALKSKFRSR